MPGDDGGADGDDGGKFWYLRLYVAGQSPRSLDALADLTSVCEEHLPGRYEIEVVDLVEHPSRAESDDIIAIPTLVRRLPEPLRRIIGDLSDVDRVLVGLRVGDHAVPLTAEPAPAEPDADVAAEYEFTLFVSGASDLSARAIANARQLFDRHVDGRYRLSVIDIYEDPAAVVQSQVLAIPTLIKNRPEPVRRLVGDLSRAEQVVVALGLPAHDDAQAVGR